MDVYQIERSKYQALFDRFSKKSRWYGWLRLAAGLSIACCLYLFIRNREILFALTALALSVIFVALVSLHASVDRRRRFYRQLVLINEREIAALTGDFSAFDDGARYADPQHPYTWDLDVFGQYSFYQYVNRSANRIGADRLAAYFQREQTKPEILDTQAAVRDLAPRLVWRQEFLATGQLHADLAGDYRLLLQWAAQPARAAHPALAILWKTLPIVTLGLALYCLAFPAGGGLSWLQAMAVFNLLATAAHGARIQSELRQLNAVIQPVKQYGLLLQCIENETFESEKIESLRRSLFRDGMPASGAVLSLSRLLDRLESVMNLPAALVANGLFLYHIRVLDSLQRWKMKHADGIAGWIETVGELEALSSLAQVAFNHPDFVFPDISDTPMLDMQDLGHPLIPAEKRVCNSIRFERPGLVVLTGSNMSGKSTFLRTVGLNLLLARTGLPVCAKACRVYPFALYVCMKLSDSLHDNESYFFAELKRLHHIIEGLESGAPGFVMLDEVLRGTNSADKLAGTLGLLDTMLRLNATGILATHDLSVCDLSEKHPESMRNMCFEVEIGTDSLHFDYRLRDGVCRNKSASFLMKKMGVIGDAL